MADFDAFYREGATQGILPLAESAAVLEQGCPAPLHTGIAGVADDEVYVRSGEARGCECEVVGAGLGHARRVNGQRLALRGCGPASFNVDSGDGVFPVCCELEQDEGDAVLADFDVFYREGATQGVLSLAESAAVLEQGCLAPLHTGIAGVANGEVYVRRGEARGRECEVVGAGLKHARRVYGQRLRLALRGCGGGGGVQPLPARLRTVPTPPAGWGGICLKLRPKGRCAGRCV